MKKYRDDDYWFELTEGPGPTGVGFFRYFRVTCRKCGKQVKHLASGQSNDQLRKFFVRQNWDIGRATNLHFCPDCTNRNKRPPETHRSEFKPAPSNVFPLHPPQRITLQDAWKQADEIERAEFLLKLRDANGPIFTDTREESKPEPVADDHTITEDDGEVADWWIELKKEQDHG